MSESTIAQPGTVARGRLFGLGAAVAAVAGVVNVVIGLIVGATDATASVETFNGTTQELNAFAYFISTFVPALLAAAVFALVMDRIPRTVTVMQIVGAAFTLLSLAAPLGLDATTGEKLGLISMHLAAGIVVIGSLTWAARRSTRT
jgi:hypothetical protein